ncbi:MAG: hypothetical protein Ct9H300mP12_01070 [Acidimicrobiales bacterium]|nr:MAG: hypothetical protein Ct9H300mP12_01070 [Acidimicrobiales bacterium]
MQDFSRTRRSCCVAWPPTPPCRGPGRPGSGDRFLHLAPDSSKGSRSTTSVRPASGPGPPGPTFHVDTEHIAPIRISVADAVTALVDEIPRQGTVTFRHLTRDLFDRIEIVVRFLAVLELYKQGVVEIDHFGELRRNPRGLASGRRAG